MRIVVYGSLLLCVACGSEPELDVILRNGSVFDGSGGPPRVVDVGIQGDRITTVGDLGSATSPIDIDVQGLAVAPGFINMLSWAGDRLVADGRSQSDIRQGVTLEVFGEGTSGGPLSEEMKISEKAGQGDIQFDIEWTTFGEYLTYLETKGISTNVASFVGATTIRMHELGEENRFPTPEELERMKALVRESMEQGALGLGSSLIYAPAFYADTDELVALSRVAAEYGGLDQWARRDEASGVQCVALAHRALDLQSDQSGRALTVRGDHPRQFLADSRDLILERVHVRHAVLVLPRSAPVLLGSPQQERVVRRRVAIHRHAV